jgi:urease subunit alpha
MLDGSRRPITVGIDCGGAWNVAKMLRAAERSPFNFGFLSHGKSSKPRSLIDQFAGGSIDHKNHQDWGAMPSVIDTCLSVAEEPDILVQRHTDTLNESGCREDTLEAMMSRTIHLCATPRQARRENSIH